MSETRTQRGSILVLVALSMTVLLSMAALSIDASFMYDKRNRIYAAADAAAKSAALEYRQNNAAAYTTLRQFAMNEVSRHGFTSVAWGDNTSCPSGALQAGANVCLHHPPTSGPFAGNNGHVEVIVQEPTGTFFGRILGTTSLSPGARAVAGAADPVNCLIVNEDLEFDQYTFDLDGCGAAIGGDLLPQKSNSIITGDPLPSVGAGDCIEQGQGDCDNMGVLTEGASAPADPLANLPTPPCTTALMLGGTPTINPGCYSAINGNVTTMNPGIYYVTGRMEIGPSLTATNVMIFLAAPGGFLYTSASGNKVLTISAPTTGDWKGIAIFQDRSNSTPIDDKNNFTINLTGVVYMPSVDVDFKNNFEVNNTTCSLFIVRSLTVKNGGRGGFTNSGCSALYGNAAFLSVSMAE